MALFSLFLTAGAKSDEAQPFESVYTNLGKSCTGIRGRFAPGKKLEGHTYLKCPGVGGYTVLLDRLANVKDDSLRLLSPSGIEIRLPASSGDCFPYIAGKKLEWRVTKDPDKKIVPHALIVRLNADSCKSGMYETTSYLAVVKLTAQEVCFTDQILPGPRQNENARQSADTATHRLCVDKDLEWCHDEGEPCGH